VSSVADSEIEEIVVEETQPRKKRRTNDKSETYNELRNIALSLQKSSEALIYDCEVMMGRGKRDVRAAGQLVDAIEELLDE
jgi:hypothetical protein